MIFEMSNMMTRKRTNLYKRLKASGIYQKTTVL